ncbi:MAG TPA: glycine oxidase ThiO [Candidatus Polarisedimenticolaceae bacterium]|nr:glycine oxidase ThiO [Candidatus Polarisedimenticolaceae bacterium]
MTIRRTDVTVVGGGVIGLSVAAELLRRGVAVDVIDRGPIPGYATAAAAGMLAPVSEAELEDEVVLPLALDSLARFPAFVDWLERTTGLPCDYRTDGTLWVAVTRDDRAELEHIHHTLTERIGGMPARWLSAGEVHAREPHLSGRVLCGLWVERDLQVDPRALTAALERAIVAAGGTIERGTRVVGIIADGGVVRAVELATPDGVARRAAGGVVLAAGAWSGHELRLPLGDLGIRPVKGQLIRLAGAPLLRHVVRHPEAYLVPRGTGELLVGATMEEVGFDPAVTAGAVHDILRKAWQLLPGLYDLELREVSVGFRPMSRDNRPVIGPTAIAGLYLAVGHGRQGVLLAPATAQLLADAITTGRVPEVLLPFAIDRFGGATATVGG